MDTVISFLSGLDVKEFIALVLAIVVFYVGVFVAAKNKKLGNQNTLKIEVTVSIVCLLILVVGFN